jgi:hypothetical protein
MLAKNLFVAVLLSVTTLPAYSLPVRVDKRVGILHFLQGLGQGNPNGNLDLANLANGLQAGIAALVYFYKA